MRKTRRSFIKRTAGGTAGFLILTDSRSVWGAPANERLNIALIGCGGRGEWFVDTVPKAQNLVALCDVNEERAAKAFQKLPGVPRHHDFREMLERRAKEIDAIIIAAPDHIHAPATMLALQMGKPVFCEKPLTHTLHEARLVRATAAKTKVATQLGNQGTSSEAFRRAVELVQAGVIGEVREVRAWNEGGGAGKTQRPAGEQPVPSTLKWDLFLGPALPRPYHREWMNWHAWRDFATGQLGNWASHTMNLPFKALKLDTLWDADAGSSAEPRGVRVRAESEQLNKDSFPGWEIISYEFPARGPLPPVKLTWYNGNRIPRGRADIEKIVGRKLDWGDAGEKKWKDYAGCLLIGTEGVIHSTGHNMSFTLLPEDKFKDLSDRKVPHTLARVSNHEEEWYRACHGGAAPMSSFEYGGRLAEFTLLGNIATLYPEQMIEFDPLTAKIIKPAEANAFLTKDYREGWKL
jgi:hypothetical protein